MKLLATVLMTVVLAFIITIPTVGAGAQTTVTTTTTTATEQHHFWNPNHWFWRHGLENPFGLFQGSNVVIVPSQTLSQSVVNTCPSYAPVLLSTGQCLTIQQALYEIQTGQIQVGGQVHAFGNIIVGLPSVLAATGFSDPFVFFHHYHHDLDNDTHVGISNEINLP